MVEVVSAGDLEVGALEDLLCLVEQKSYTYFCNVKGRKDVTATCKEAADVYNKSVRMNLILLL